MHRLSMYVLMYIPGTYEKCILICLCVVVQYIHIPIRSHKKIILPFFISQQFCFDVSSVNGDIFVNGGSSSGRWQNVLYRYSVEENSWTLLPAMKRPRRRCASAAVEIEVAPAKIADGNDAVEKAIEIVEGESKKAKMS